MTFTSESTSLENLQAAIRSVPTTQRLAKWDAEYADGRVRLLSQFPGWSVEKYAILQLVAQESLTGDAIVLRLERAASNGYLLLPEGCGDMEIGSVWRGDVKGVLDGLLREGLLRKGIPDPSWKQIDAIDIWDVEEIEFCDESLTLSETGKALWCWIERSMLELPLTRSRQIGDMTLHIASSPPFFGNGCFNSTILWTCPECELSIINNPELDEQCGCRAGIFPAWRADWWRTPQPGFFILCRNDDRKPKAATWTPASCTELSWPPAYPCRISRGLDWGWQHSPRYLINEPVEVGDRIAVSTGPEKRLATVTDIRLQTFRSHSTQTPERELVIETQFDDGDCWGWTRFDDTVELLERAP